MCCLLCELNTRNTWLTVAVGFHCLLKLAQLFGAFSLCCAVLCFLGCDAFILTVISIVNTKQFLKKKKKHTNQLGGCIFLWGFFFSLSEISEQTCSQHLLMHKAQAHIDFNPLIIQQTNQKVDIQLKANICHPLEEILYISCVKKHQKTNNTRTHARTHARTLV